MNNRTSFGDPIGPVVPDWRPPARPLRVDMTGRSAALEALTPDEHGAALWEAFSDDPEGRIWTYMPKGPFADEAAFRDWLEADCMGDDPLFFAIRDQSSGRIGGMASYLRIAPEAGSIEVGNIAFAPRLQRTRAATEAMFLMMERAFDLGYRRYEWKCNALNAPSRRAAQRLGFSYEGVFRQALVVKGRNRDTAWYAMIDAEWPRLRAAFETWLSDDNFDEAGRQRVALADLTAPILVARG